MRRRVQIVVQAETAAMFVVLEHSVPGAPAATHWDFLLEVPEQERLATWRLAHNPLETTDDIPAERLADHRRLYLDFEGELSGGRGSVRRMERGTATIERLSGVELVALLAGTRLRGRFEIMPTPDGHLVFRPAGSCRPGALPFVRLPQ